MARRGASEDPKVAALREARCLNPHPADVTDEAFRSQEFFDARDAVQVKYEMVRRVRVDGDSVTAAAAAFGYSRPSYYDAAAALDDQGLDGLVLAPPQLSDRTGGVGAGMVLHRLRRRRPGACDILAKRAQAIAHENGGGAGNDDQDAETRAAAQAEAERRERRKVIALNKLGDAAQQVRRQFIADKLLTRLVD